MHSGRVGVAAYEWYLLHRYHRLSGGWCWRPSVIDEGSTGKDHHVTDNTKDMELQQT